MHAADTARVLPEARPQDTERDVSTLSTELGRALPYHD
jgi:hypothetical protein